MKKKEIIKDPIITKRFIFDLLFFIIAWIVSIFLEIGSFIFVIGVIYLIFRNLGERKKNTLSAYSVFNKNCESLPGTIKNDIPGFRTFDNSKQETRDVKNDPSKVYFEKSSKMSNSPCYCGSNKKFKKCCQKQSNDNI